MIADNAQGLSPSLRAAIVVPWLCVLAFGCRERGPEMVPVRGRVTLDGGAWPEKGTVFFVPVEVPDGFPRRPAEGSFDTDGRFRVTSFAPGDGLVPGTYRVHIECWKTPPSEENLDGVTCIAADFKPPHVTIEPGTRTPVEISFDVPQAK